MWKRCRSTAKRYPGDNRLIVPKSPYRRHCLAPRCRLIASWGRSRSQGLGCSPIKAVRELGLERRETVNIALSVNSAKCWKLRKHPAVPPLSHPSVSVRTTAEVTIRQVDDPSDHAGQSAGKAGRLPGGIRRRGRKLPRRDPTESVHTVRLATRTRVPPQPEPRASFDPRALASQTRLRPDPAQCQSRWSRQVARLRGTEPRRSSDKVIPFFRAHPILSE